LVRFVGILIFIAILAELKILYIFTKLINANPSFVLLSVFSFFTMHLFKAFRWKYLLKTHQITLSLKSSYLMYTSGLFFGLLTPGRLGDFVKITYLKKYGVDVVKGFFVNVFDRLLDLIFLLLLAIIISATFFNEFIINILILSFTIFSVIFIFYLLGNNKNNGLKLFLGIILGNNNKNILLSKFNDFFSLLNNHSIQNTISLIVISSISWLVYILSIFFLSESINLGLSYSQVGIFFIISSIIALIPISFAGIGTRDMVLILLFSKIGYSKEEAISFSIIILTMYLFTAAIGLISWLLLNDQNYRMKI